MALFPLTARNNHSTVWTGSEMIIWGGSYYSGSTVALQDGARYQPAIDSWTPITTTNAPSPRDWHSGVWTGSEMLIWGGRFVGCGLGCIEYLDNGKRYDPATDTWQDMAAAPLTPRYQHTAVWTGSEMIVWGGAAVISDTGYLANDGARYNPTTNSWTPLAPSGLTGRVGHSALWTGSEMLIWGGEYYDPETGQHFLERWGALRSGDGQLGTHLLRQCAFRSFRLYRCLDGSGDDRLGRDV